MTYLSLFSRFWYAGSCLPLCMWQPVEGGKCGSGILALTSAFCQLIFIFFQRRTTCLDSLEKWVEVCYVNPHRKSAVWCKGGKAPTVLQLQN